MQGFKSEFKSSKAGRKGGHLYVESELVSKRWFYIRVFERRMDFMTGLSKGEKETIWRTSQGDRTYSL